MTFSIAAVLGIVKRLSPRTPQKISVARTPEFRVSDFQFAIPLAFAAFLAISPAM
jgi:hypothetical protein